MAYKAKHLSGEFQLIDHDEIRWLPIEVLDSLKWAPADLPIIEALKLIENPGVMFKAYEPGFL